LQVVVLVIEVTALVAAAVQAVLEQAQVYL
jgi:hypothetical protein